MKKITTVVEFLEYMQEKINKEHHKIGFLKQDLLDWSCTFKKGSLCIYSCYKNYDDCSKIWDGTFAYTYYFLSDLTDIGIMTVKAFKNLVK